MVAPGASPLPCGVARKLISIEQQKEKQEMADEQKTTQKEPGSKFYFACCGDWSRVKPDHMKGCDCAEMMSKMMDLCSGATPEPSAPEKTGTPDPTV